MQKWWAAGGGGERGMLRRGQGRQESKEGCNEVQHDAGAKTPSTVLTNTQVAARTIYRGHLRFGTIGAQFSCAWVMLRIDRFAKPHATPKYNEVRDGVSTKIQSTVLTKCWWPLGQPRAAVCVFVKTIPCRVCAYVMLHLVFPGLALRQRDATRCNMNYVQK